jgi:hypothetical protein
MGLWLVLAGMLAQVLAPCVAAVFWLGRIDLLLIVLAFQAANLLLLPLALQMAGHWLCLRVPKAVRMGHRAKRSDLSVVVKTRKGLRRFGRRRARGSPARSIVVTTLILDVLGLVMLGWSGAARFKLLPRLDWLPDPDLVFLVPLVFLLFLGALARYIKRSYLSWSAHAIFALLVFFSSKVLIESIMPILIPRHGGAEVGLGVVANAVVANEAVAIGLAVLYLAYLCLLFFLARATSRYAAQLTDQAVVAAVEKLGGSVQRDGMIRLKLVAGIRVEFPRNRVTDGRLKNLVPLLARLKGFTALTLPDNVAVTDAGLKEIAKLKGLTTLELTCSKVTGAGLKELAPLQGLTYLDFSRTEVGDAGLKEFARLKGLTALYLEGTKVTDRGLRELALLAGLTTLDLACNKEVTDAGLKAIAKLNGLITLNLQGTSITDAGLKELAPLKGLTRLNGLTNLYLFDTAVTDAGLKEIAKLKGLTTLTLPEPASGVTQAGVAELRKALPNCAITFSGAAAAAPAPIPPDKQKTTAGPGQPPRTKSSAITPATKNRT